MVLFSTFASIYYLNPYDKAKIIAIIAAEANAHNAALDGAILNIRSLSYRVYPNDVDPRDFAQTHVLPERRWGRYDNASDWTSLGYPAAALL